MGYRQASNEVFCRRSAFASTALTVITVFAAACGGGDGGGPTAGSSGSQSGTGISGSGTSGTGGSEAGSSGTGISGSASSGSGSSGTGSGFASGAPAGSGAAGSSAALDLDASVGSPGSDADVDASSYPKMDGSSNSGSTSSSGTSSGNGSAGGTGSSGRSGSGGGTDASSGSGSEAGSGTDASTSCGFAPVTPNATPQAHNVLCYLHQIYGSHILSGQEEDNNDNGMNTVYQATGKYPAIRSFDVNNSQAPTQCVAQWKAGGLCMFGYHMGINGASYSSATNIGNVLTPGTSENTSFNKDLDRIASYVQPVQDAGGVAILRLFHEAGQSCKWFWWTMGSSTQWQDLFRYAFKYLTATKGLKSVLWIAPLCGSPSSAYNPGAQYIDIGGADDYVAAGDYEPLTSLFQQTEQAFPNMMVALHECGSIPDPVKLQSTATKWLFFNVWASPYFNSPYNPTAHLQEVYSNPYVITRDKLPSFQ